MIRLPWWQVRGIVIAGRQVRIDQAGWQGSKVGVIRKAEEQVRVDQANRGQSKQISNMFNLTKK